MGCAALEQRLNKISRSIYLSANGWMKTIICMKKPLRERIIQAAIDEYKRKEELAGAQTAQF